MKEEILMFTFLKQIEDIRKEMSNEKKLRKGES